MEIVFICLIIYVITSAIFITILVVKDKRMNVCVNESFTDYATHYTTLDKSVFNPSRIAWYQYTDLREMERL